MDSDRPTDEQQAPVHVAVAMAEALIKLRERMINNQREEARAREIEPASLRREAK